MTSHQLSKDSNWRPLCEHWICIRLVEYRVTHNCLLRSVHRTGKNARSSCRQVSGKLSHTSLNAHPWSDVQLSRVACTLIEKLLSCNVPNLESRTASCIDIHTPAEPSRGFGILEWSGKVVSQGTLVKGAFLSRTADMPEALTAPARLVCAADRLSYYHSHNEDHRLMWT